MVNSIGLIAAYSKPEATDLAKDIVAWLAHRSIEVVPETRLKQAPLESLDAIIVLGGDGLMMRTANTYPDVPLLGINFGKVGFLALVEQAEVIE